MRRLVCLFDDGRPGRSGIVSGIVIGSPGRGAWSEFAPSLDRAGNRLKGQLVPKLRSRRLAMGPFASRSELEG
jgi:glutaminase